MHVPLSCCALRCAPNMLFSCRLLGHTFLRSWLTMKVNLLSGFAERSMPMPMRSSLSMPMRMKFRLFGSSARTRIRRRRAKLFCPGALSLPSELLRKVSVHLCYYMSCFRYFHNVFVIFACVFGPLRRLHHPTASNPLDRHSFSRQFAANRGITPRQEQA